MKKLTKFNNVIFIIVNLLNLIILPILSKLNLILFMCLFVLYIITNFVFRNSSNIKTFNKIIFFILLFLTILFFLINQFNILDYLGSVHEIKNFVLSTKEWGIIAFVLIELLDVLILPIPSFIIILAGVNIWGVTKTIFICGITVVVGSCVSFIIGKFWGTKAIEKIVGLKKFNQYKNVLDRHAKLYLTFMFIFPFFPDDLLCLLAGTTNIKFYEFLLISLFTRPISIIVTALLGEYFFALFETYSVGRILSLVGIFALAIIILAKNKKNIINRFKKIVNKKSC